MHTYRVTGILLICLFSRPTKAHIRVEVSALAAHKAAAERHDPQATVVWKEAPQVRRLTALAWQA